ncbi:MAG: recombinase family protein [Christensenella sp.]|nr:recombinase family protein [Christensenella sp.]
MLEKYTLDIKEVESLHVYGYARVSAKDQNEDRQMLSLAAFPVKQKKIFLDKMSGKDFNRPQYQKLMGKLKPGDTLVLHSIDRLGRNYEEVIEQWRYITKVRKVDIVVLDMPLLDTRKGKDLTGTLIADIVLQLLSYVAQTERENIKKRQAEGIAAAKKRGARFGRPKKPVPVEFEEIADQWMDGKISAREAGKRLNVTHNTFLRWIRAKKNY